MRLLTGMVAGLALGIGGLAAACGSGGSGGSAGSGASGTGGGEAGVCSPGAQEACACAGGVMGQQTCKADGSGFGPCQGCGGATTGTSASTSGSGSGGSDAGVGDAGGDYPAGPYGLTKGAVVPNLALQGFGDAVKNSTTVQSFSLGDFYDPSGSGVFPAGSPLGAGQAKPRALLVFFGALWTEPANDEAKNQLPPQYVKLAPAGGQFVTILIDGISPGTPATATNLFNWVTEYQVDYPSGIEVPTMPGSVTVFPLNLIVDPRTMKIIDVLEGEPVQGECGTFSGCAVDADCQVCSSSMCGDGTSCTGDGDCAGKTCTPFPFWTEYAALLGLDGG